MYGYIPPSNFQNNYGYSNPPQPRYVAPIYGPPAYSPNQPPYYQNSQGNYANNKNSIYNNNNYKNVQSLQPLALNMALEQSSYPAMNRDYIKKYIINDYFQNKNAKVYFQSFPPEKIFVIEYSLSIKFNNRSYPIVLFIHIPSYFPNYPPEIYIQKKPNVGLNNSYINGKINPNNFKINLDEFEKFEPEKNNIQKIIDNIIKQFNKDFPIYKLKVQSQKEIFDKNNIDKNKFNEVIIETDTFTDNQFLNFMKEQVKNALKSKYMELNQKYNFFDNHNKLTELNAIVKQKCAQNEDIYNTPMGKEVENMKRIKIELDLMENSLQKEIQSIQNGNKGILDKCEDFITIKDKKDLEYVVMKKTLEDYLLYLKKGYEKNVVTFDEMVNNTRMLSREIFTIDYLRKQRKKYSN